MDGFLFLLSYALSRSVPHWQAPIAIHLLRTLRRKRAYGLHAAFVELS